MIVLPKSWNDVTFDQYQKLIDLIKPDARLSVSELLDNNINVLSVLSGVAVDVFEEMPFSDVNALMGQLRFMNEPVGRSKAGFKIRSAKSITFDMFVKYNKLAENGNANQIDYLSIFTDIDKQQLASKPIPEIMQGFFLLNRKLNLYAMRSAISLILKRTRTIAKMIMGKRKSGIPTTN